MPPPKKKLPRLQRANKPYTGPPVDVVGGQKFYDGLNSRDYPFPKDSNMTPAQLHANNAMGQRYGVDPGEVRYQTGIADNLDPAQVALRQQAKNPPPQRGDMQYTGFGRVRDPAVGGTFHKGSPHDTYDDVNYKPDPNWRVGRPSLKALGQGLQSAGSDAMDDWHDMVMGPADDMVKGAIKNIQQAFPNKNGKAPAPAASPFHPDSTPDLGGKTVAQKASAAYQPQMTDPVSGRKMKKGRPVPAANAAPPQAGPVVDPVSGQKMQKGNPVPTAYSGALNQQVGQGLETAGRALGMGFKPPTRFAGNSQAPAATPAPATTPRGLKTTTPAPKTPGLSGGATPGSSPLAAPGARAAPITSDLSKLQSTKANTPGYTDFPPTKRTKQPPYPY